MCNNSGALEGSDAETLEYGDSEDVPQKILNETK
jgi:hypothetical protein